MQVKFFSHYLHLPFGVLALAEGAAVGGAAFAALSFGRPPGDPSWPMAAGALLVALLSLIVMTAFGMFSRRFRERRAGMVLRIGIAVAIGALGAVIIAAVIRHHAWISPGDLPWVIPAAIVAAGMVRFVFGNVLDEDTFRRRVLVYGAGTRAGSIAALRRRSDQRGFKLVGFMPVDGEPALVAREQLLDPAQPLAGLVRSAQVDEIVVAMDDRRRNFPVSDLIECRLGGTDITDVTTFLERETGKVRIDVLHPSWLIFSEGFRRDLSRRATRRAFDLLVGVALLVLASPLMLLTMIAIKLEDGWRAPVLYRQQRVGLQGRIFDVLKFRSMRTDAESDGRARWAQRNDTRVTRVGAFIRKVRLDELPQLINVIRSEMSFVGPRPERPEFVEQLAESIPFYRERHWVKPGITGWAQICYPYGASERDAIEKLQYDLYYVKNHTLMFDIMILLQTAETVLFSRGAH